MIDDLINHRAVGMRISKLLDLGLQFSYPALESIGRRVCGIVKFFGFVIIIAKAEKVEIVPVRKKLFAATINPKTVER